MSQDFIFQYEPEIKEEDITAVKDYLESGAFITEFKQTREFENLIKQFCRVNEASIFPNGTLTLFSILKQLNIGNGHKVIVPNYTMAATAFSVKETGAEVIFCDIEWPSLCISIKKLKKIIEEYDDKISAVMFMSANGRFPSYDIEELVNICVQNDIYLIEDSAQALGSFYKDGSHIGTKGIAGSISFSMPKILTTGQGGAIISNNHLFMKKIKGYRDFGRVNGGGSDFHDFIGLNFKYSDLQAVLGISQFKRINQTINIKKENYHILRELINNKYLILLDNDTKFTTPWFYEIVTEYQKEFITWLKSKNIGCRQMYPELNKQKAFIGHEQYNQIFQNSRKISNQGVWIPSHPKLTISQIEYISETINQFKPNICKGN